MAGRPRRDADGHLCSQHAPFEDDQAIAWYVRDALARGQVVTVWPMAVREDPDTATPFGAKFDTSPCARNQAQGEGKGGLVYCRRCRETVSVRPAALCQDTRQQPDGSRSDTP